jgi:hypothetical protein
MMAAPRSTRASAKPKGDTPAGDAATQAAAATPVPADAPQAHAPADTPPADDAPGATPDAAAAAEPEAPAPSRRGHHGLIAVDSLFYAGKIIEAGDELPEGFPEDRVRVLLDKGQVE